LEEDIHFCYENYANCYFIKPTHWDAFGEIVKHVNDVWLSLAKLPGRISHRTFRSPTSAAAIAIIVLFGVPVLAADMAVKAPPPAVTPGSPTWTGFYVGANAGYAWHDPGVTFAPNDPLSQYATCSGGNGGTCPTGSSFNLAGGLGGLQAGDAAEYGADGRKSRAVS
jgi:hypothetical protein